MTDPRTFEQKCSDLHRALLDINPAEGNLLVAYSGGVDSAYLAWEAHAVLGHRMLAVIADSPSLPRKEFAAAVEFAELHAIPLRVVETAELESAAYARNDSARCFHCKDELFRVMETLAQQFPATSIAYGRNLDDDGDFRPGQRAAEQHAIVAPLATARLTKLDVRTLARQTGLTLWDKPASACLASRVEYGRPVTAETLQQVELAEEHLHELGFRQVRVRHHGELARVEIDRLELGGALSLAMLDRITAGIRACGFKYVALDTEGYRSGAMNEALGMNDLVPLASLTRKA